ncbi:hypothetical protein [Bacillus mycoides]|uniref:hypothetical protein n=1 Tax=Bacillus mycoides TaxID=1405 RepID=UPI00164292E2|nr:hypothetical protein [Bacillus mycoides]
MGKGWRVRIRLFLNGIGGEMGGGGRGSKMGSVGSSFVKVLIGKFNCGNVKGLSGF